MEEERTVARLRDRSTHVVSRSRQKALLDPRLPAVPVSQEHIDAIVEAARVAPTAANRQPVRILQVTSEEGLASLAKAANVFDAPLAFVVCADGEKAWKRPLDGMSTVHVDASILTDT